jgi:small subunit ribosomal protein S8
MTNDLVSDMLTRIRNASLAKHSFTQVNYSKLSLAILKVLLAENYILGFEIEKKERKSIIRVFLKYKGWWIKKSFFSTLKRISKPGNRVFCGYKQFDKVIDILRYQQGTAIISTSSGVMSHIKAKKLKKGGEILCYVG